MKRVWIVCVVALCLGLIFAACEGGSTANVAITTTKAGKIEADLYTADAITKGKVDLTPVVGVEDKSITDDGKGLYNITLRQYGEGDVSLAAKKVQAGTTVTVNAIPADEWKSAAYMLDGQPNDGNTFVMPTHDVTFEVTFVSMRHEVGLAGYNDEYYIARETGDSAVAGMPFYFSIDTHDDYYYDSVFVESIATDEYGNRQSVDVHKVGTDRFFFVMPDFACRIGWNKRTFGSVTDVLYFIQNDLGELHQIDQNEVANHIAVMLTMDGEPFEVNTRVKQHVATVTITYLNPLYEIDDLRFGYYGSTTKVDDTHYTFTVVYDSVYIILKDKAMPAGSHTITLRDTSHGSISVTAPWASANDTVVVTVSPDEEYVLHALRYTTDGEKYTDIVAHGGVYSFVMPDGDVDIEATFREAPAAVGLQLSVCGDKFNGDMSDYNVVDVVNGIYMDVNEAAVECGEIVNDMILPTGTGTVHFVVLLNDGYELLGIYFRNEDVSYYNSGWYGEAVFEVEEGINDLVLMVMPY